LKVNFNALVGHGRAANAFRASRIGSSGHPISNLANSLLTNFLHCLRVNLVASRKRLRLQPPNVPLLLQKNAPLFLQKMLPRPRALQREAAGGAKRGDSMKVKTPFLWFLEVAVHTGENRVQTPRLLEAKAEGRPDRGARKMNNICKTTFSRSVLLLSINCASSRESELRMRFEAIRRLLQSISIKRRKKECWFTTGGEG
jgi:hypothetical protein